MTSRIRQGLAVMFIARVRFQPTGRHEYKATPGGDETQPPYGSYENCFNRMPLNACDPDREKSPGKEVGFRQG